MPSCISAGLGPAEAISCARPANSTLCAAERRNLVLSVPVRMLRDELVAGVVHRQKVNRIGRVSFQLLPQSQDVRIDSSR